MNKLFPPPPLRRHGGKFRSLPHGEPRPPNASPLLRVSPHCLTPRSHHARLGLPGYVRSPWP